MKSAFEGKVAVITGASSGIGAAVAREFAHQGARVALLARRKDKLEATQQAIAAAGGSALAVACDITDRASLDAAMAQVVEAFGRIDVVLANAGTGVTGSFERLETEDFRRQFETNVFGVIDTFYAAWPEIVKVGGRLGVVGSIMGRMGMPASAPYCASKFAVSGLAECLYYDCRKHGVSMTLISPGLVESEIRSKNNFGEETGKPDPAPQWIVMPVDAAAKKIVRAMYKRQPEYVVTGHGQAAVFLARHFPRTTRALFKLSSRSGLNSVEKAKQAKAEE